MLKSELRMNSFWRIFFLEWIALVRTRTFALLLAASVAWILLLPYAVHGDGTAEGLREICIRYSLGGVFVIVAITLLSSATGSLAKERAAKRLQLTMVRPVRFTVIALGKWFAYVTAGAVVLAIAFICVAFRVDLSSCCDHVVSPVLPSPAEEAKDMYAAYMADPETPVEVKKAKKDVVLRLLAQRALDHYQTMPTNDVVAWKFPTCEPRAVRIRFTNQFEMREPVVGGFAFGSGVGVVSNITQAVIEVPLVYGSGQEASSQSVLAFRNDGKSSLMIRPRKDIHLLVVADEFWKNAIRAYAELVSVLSLLVAFGVFLSSGLGRPVALFTAIVVMIIAEMSPSVVEQYPDELETKAVDRLGLVITRFAAEATKPLTALTPLTALSNDECIETREVARTFLVDGVVASLFLAMLSAVIMPRKQGDSI